MPSELPIACSLNASELAVRVAGMADFGQAALIDAEAGPTTARLRFAAGIGIRRRVEAIMAAESRCCGFLQMRVSEDPDTIVLTIDAPAGAELVLAELVDAFRAEQQAA
jgi:hypothetical protein